MKAAFEEVERLRSFLRRGKKKLVENLVQARVADLDDYAAAVLIQSAARRMMARKLFQARANLQMRSMMAYWTSNSSQHTA